MSTPPPKTRGRKLSHITADGSVHMVDVGSKPVTARRAVAEGCVCVSAALARAIAGDSLAKGNLLEIAKIAGIQAAKRTDELIPLCHTLPLDHVQLDAWLDRHQVCLRATATTFSRTGVEMEALTAVAVAALTVIDMGKAIDQSITIEHIHVTEKSGGRSGHHRSASRLPSQIAHRRTKPSA